MSFKLWHKNTFIITCIVIVGSFIYYSSLSTRHKAIVKTHLLHSLNLVDSDWIKTNTENTLEFISPTFVIDDIYKSMEGPKASQYFSLNTNKSELLWMTGFKVNAIQPKTEQLLSNDFICHFNIDYLEQEHYGKWNLLNRMNIQYPRLLSLSHGVEGIEFPDGFGFPFFSDEKFFITTQALNHNITDSIIRLKHKIDISYANEKTLKPLFPKTIYMMLPFEMEELTGDYNDIPANSCIPVETKNHTYLSSDGKTLSGHWKEYKGKKTYTYNTTKQLAIKDTLTLHQVIPHLHPFAEKFTLTDITNNTIIYSCKVINHKEGIGLTKTPDLSSKEGIIMYPTHEYELELTINNTTNDIQDMMGSLFLFFYDKEMDGKIKKYNYAN